MDRWEPCIRMTTRYVPGAREKIAFDSSPLPDAVDRVRRVEHRRPAGADDQWREDSRYRWSNNPSSGTRSAASCGALGAMHRVALERLADRPSVGLARSMR